MTRFLKWLETPATSAKEIFSLAVKTLLLSVLWGTLMALITWLLVVPNYPVGSATLERNMDQFLSNFTEEFFFRTLWLALAVMVIGRNRVMGLALILTFTGSLVWGYDHRFQFMKITTPNMAATIALCWIGGMGALFNILAIKCATNDDLLQLKPLGIFTIVHFGYNLMIVPIVKVIVLLSGVS
ncbi:MAG: hypothetical protein G01um101419_191 [Parcubacteria group bacterium Gr01-1014_19]|nr:MAG: hypothetical protein G01um101419_191 [Parcubacteria group bacterium Gr01-1014_19]